jgi:hypothetical protein
MGDAGTGAHPPSRWSGLVWSACVPASGWAWLAFAAQPKHMVLLFSGFVLLLFFFLYQLARLNFRPLIFSQSAVFFFHNKSANSTFSRLFSAKRIGC